MLAEGMYSKRAVFVTLHGLCPHCQTTHEGGRRGTGPLCDSGIVEGGSITVAGL